MRRLVALGVGIVLAGCDALFGLDHLRAGADASVDAPPDAPLPPDAMTALPVDQIATGFEHTCARRGTALRCWGASTRGQLGYGNTDSIGDNELPMAAGDIDIGAEVAHVVAGQAHTCVRTPADAVHCWGWGDSGRTGHSAITTIGDNEPPSARSLVAVGAPVRQLDAGDSHTCAVTGAGTVRCWGDGQYGRLGYGEEVDIGDNEPPSNASDVQVGASVAMIATGGAHTCALLATAGAVRCWGLAADGRLGYGNTNNIGDNEYPSTAGNVPLAATATQVVAGGSHTCALLTSGAVRCWGLGTSGQLGYGTTASIGDDEPPSADVDLGGTAVGIAAGTSHTCALLDDFTVRCWGKNGFGQLGYADLDLIGDNEVPSAMPVVAVGGPVRAIAAGGDHTCALLENRAVRCWGRGAAGQLGYGNVHSIGDDEHPATAGDVQAY